MVAGYFYHCNISLEIAVAINLVRVFVWSISFRDGCVIKHTKLCSDSSHILYTAVCWKVVGKKEKVHILSSESVPSVFRFLSSLELNVILTNKSRYALSLQWCFPRFPWYPEVKEPWPKNYPKWLSGLSRALRFSDGLFVNSCMELGQLLGRYLIVNL